MDVDCCMHLRDISAPCSIFNIFMRVAIKSSNRALVVECMDQCGFKLPPSVTISEREMAFVTGFRDVHNVCYKAVVCRLN
jgi:hypothetical protein